MLVHRAYTDSLQITPTDANWIFDQVVFFVDRHGDDNIELMEYSYTQGTADHVYALDIDHDWIDVSALIADEIAIAEIRKL